MGAGGHEADTIAMAMKGLKGKKFAVIGKRCGDKSCGDGWGWGHNSVEGRRLFFYSQLAHYGICNCVRYALFLRATACNAKRVFATAEASVCPSYCCIVSKRHNLGS